MYKKFLEKVNETAGRISLSSNEKTNKLVIFSLLLLSRMFCMYVN